MTVEWVAELSAGDGVEFGRIEGGDPEDEIMTGLTVRSGMGEKDSNSCGGFGVARAHPRERSGVISI